MTHSCDAKSHSQRITTVVEVKCPCYAFEWMRGIERREVVANAGAIRALLRYCTRDEICRIVPKCGERIRHGAVFLFECIDESLHDRRLCIGVEGRSDISAF